MTPMLISISAVLLSMIALATPGYASGKNVVIGQLAQISNSAVRKTKDGVNDITNNTKKGVEHNAARTKEAVKDTAQKAVDAGQREVQKASNFATNVAVKAGSVATNAAAKVEEGAQKVENVVTNIVGEVKQKVR